MDDRFDMPLASTTQPALDHEALERILALGGTALRTALCEQLIADFQRLREDIADTDPTRISRAAHELKGLAATVGAITVTDMARNLDAAAQTLPAAASAAIIPTLQGQVDRVVAMLQGARQGNAGA